MHKELRNLVEEIKREYNVSELQILKMINEEMSIYNNDIPKVIKAVKTRLKFMII